VWEVKVYCDPSRGETYKESGVPLKASGVPLCTPVRAAVTLKEANGKHLVTACFDQNGPVLRRA
jgi:hypothetical protein